MKFFVEVLSHYPPPEKLPVNGPIDSKLVRSLGSDGRSMTLGRLSLPGFEDVPPLALLQIRHQNKNNLIVEVLSDEPTAQDVLINEPVAGKNLLVLSPDGKSITPGGIRLPGFEDIPPLSLLCIKSVI